MNPGVRSAGTDEDRGRALRDGHPVRARLCPADHLVGRLILQGATPLAFRLRRDGTNERALAVATIRNNQVVVLDPAPRSFGGFGF